MFAKLSSNSLWLSPLSALGVCIASLLVITAVSAAHAAIYSCNSASGELIFQDRPCSTHKAPQSTSVEKMPLGIHSSWFDKPVKTSGKAYCDKRSCECGVSERLHSGSLAQAVADALYLDTTWHHFNERHEHWVGLQPSSPAWQSSYRDMMVASCAILMAQKILLQFGNQVEKQLSLRALQAEARGFDEPGPCDLNIPGACQFYSDAQLYTQIKQDARALTAPRVDSALSAGID